MSTTNGGWGRGRPAIEGDWERRPELAVILNKESEFAEGPVGGGVPSVNSA